MSINLLATGRALSALSVIGLLAPVPVQAENFMNWMNPNKWFKDNDRYYDRGYGYGYPGYGYGYGYPGYGGWGGYPGYGGWGGYPGYGGWGGYPGYGGWGGYPGYGGSQQQAAPAVPQ
jgi:hypothetical protein